MEKIKIKYSEDYINNGLPKINQIKNSDWIDLRAAKEMTIIEDEYALIPLGVCMKIPSGYEAHLAARSSLFKNYGLIVTNGFGIIDESYCGNNDEWKLSVYCLEGKLPAGNGFRYSKINAGERICQFRLIEKMPQIEFEEVDHLDASSRGGFGSTGK